MPLHVDKLPFPPGFPSDSRVLGFTYPDRTGNIVGGYTLCRTAEDTINPIQDCSPPRAHNETEMLTLIHVRILGHLLSQHGFLSDAATSAISNEILRGQGAEEVDVAKLDMLGEFYKNTFIRPCECRIALTEIEIPGTAPDAFDSEPVVRLVQEELSQMVFVTPRNHDELRTQAMIREDYRRIATRTLDKAYARTLRMAGPVHESVEPLECCYIFPESNSTAIDGCENKLKNKWTLLKSLGYDDLVEHFATPRNHPFVGQRPDETHRVRDDFDTLDLWFEPVENVPNRYRMCSIWDLPYGLPDGHEVTFE